MSTSFKNLRNKIGLDDKLTFGKYKDTGLTVQDIINDDAEYIKWLIGQDKQFYQSVHDELKWQKEKQGSEPEVNYNNYNSRGIFEEICDQDWNEDIPY